MDKDAKLENLTGFQRCAILSLTIGPEISAKLFSELSEPEIELIGREMVRLENVPAKVSAGVVEEYFNMIKAEQYITMGGVEYARKILTNVLGEEKSSVIIEKIERNLHKSGFTKFQEIDLQELVTFIQSEHPQTIALILTQLTPKLAGEMLVMLPKKLQSEVLCRFAKIGEVPPETLKIVEEVLEDKISFSQTMGKFGGVKAAAEILNLVGATAEIEILDKIQEDESDLATEIKELMFVFADIKTLSKEAVREFLKEIDNSDLAVALKHTDEETKKHIFANLSERQRKLIDEEISYLGPIRLRVVEDMQKKIVSVIRRLRDEERISLSAEEEVMV
ncbi:MAG: flagellar motor switch protein FliG [Candidatus Cloacimonetes bacterium]|nr:flagellar motor switch protein FliG [Candidatus Cloacimonadota bacterium]